MENDPKHPRACICAECEKQRIIAAYHAKEKAIARRSAAACSASSECGCWAETDQGLEPQGYQVSSALSYLRVKNGAARVARCLPLERLDGKRMKRGEPRSIEMTFCPWCGKQYPQNAPAVAPATLDAASPKDVMAG